MNKGFLIFAQNNSSMDYCKIAVFCAKRLRKYTDLPISLVTDSPDWLKESQPDAGELFDKIIVSFVNVDQTKKFYDGSMYSKKLEWKNVSRIDAYELTPYDQTIILDSDYVVSSNFLEKLFDIDDDIAMFRNSYDIAQWRDDSAFQFINRDITFYWATVVYFKKSYRAELFFTLVKNIKLNWKYYRLLYKIDASIYRNDYAFSIAAHILNGDVNFSSITQIPGKKFYCLDRDILIDIVDNECKFLVEKEKYHGEYILTKTQGVDVHVMNKFSITRFIDNVR